MLCFKVILLVYLKINFKFALNVDDKHEMKMWTSNILIKAQFIVKFGYCINRQHLVKAYFSYKQWSYIWTGRMKNDVTEAVTT